MLIVEAVERTLCTVPNCVSCKAVRQMIAKVREVREKRNPPTNANAAPATAAPAAETKHPGDHVPKVFTAQKALTDEAKALHARADALTDLATALPGMQPSVIEAVNLLVQWSSQ